MPDENLAVSKMLAGTGSPLVNYSYTDVLRNTGYNKYYLYKGSSGAYMWLDNNTMQPEEIQTSGATVTADLQFNTPQNIKGDLFLQANYKINLTGTNPEYTFLSGAVYHYDGTTETELGNGRSNTYNIAAGQSLLSGAACIKINIPITKHFKAGEYLRIKETVHTSYAVYQEWIDHEPSDKFHTNLIMVPFKLDI